MRKTLCVVLTVCFLFVPVIASAAGVTLQVWNRNGLMGDIVNAFNAKMEAEKKDIKAEFTLVPYEEQQVKFITALSSQTAPDVYALDLINFPYFNSIGAFADITEKINALPFKDQFNPGMAREGVWQGKIYAVPLYNDNSALFYNKKLFKEAGLTEPPKTWAQMKEYAQKLTKGDQYGITFCGAVSGMTAFTWTPHLWMNGGDVGTEENARRTKVTLNSKEAEEALQYWADLAKSAPAGAPTYAYDDYYNGFTSEKVAMIFGGSWHIVAMSNDKPLLDFGVVLFPTPKEGQPSSSFMGADDIGIPAQTKHFEEAWEFLKFAISDEAQRDIIAKAKTVPGRLDIALKNEYFDEDPRHYVFAQSGKVGKAPYTTKWVEETNILGAMIAEALATKGEKPVKPILEKAAKDMEALWK
jgi:multiple sugar transport system substrate-binding protein